MRYVGKELMKINYIKQKIEMKVTIREKKGETTVNFLNVWIKWNEIKINFLN